MLADFSLLCTRPPTPPHPTPFPARADGFGSTLYSRGMAIARVRNRWPPRATAALDAFLSVSSTGTALGYDMQTRSYTFPI